MGKKELEELAEKVNDDNEIDDINDEEASEDILESYKKDENIENDDIDEEINVENENVENIEEELEIDEEDENIEENNEIENSKEVIEELEKTKKVEKLEDVVSSNENKKDKKKTIIIIIEIVVILLLIGLLIYFLIIKRKENSNNEISEPTTSEIQRPSSDNEYQALKQSSFGLSCDRTKDGEKIKTLKKGMIIECKLEFEVSQRVSELYFDLSNSKNLKFSSYKNESGYEVDTNLKTFKLTTYEPTSVMTGGITFYYEVTDENEKTGYIETKDIVFKDDGNQYYKVLNNLTTFPVEYDDKIYIYKGLDYDEDDSETYYYFASKYSRENLDDEDVELFDTYQCDNETCDSVASYNNYFLINDNKLILYDTLKKTTRKLKIDDNLALSDYSYELMISESKKIYGVAFKTDYVDNYVCSSNCYENGISGYNLGYYSFNTDSFTIALNYGVIGSSQFSNYDVAMLVQKGNKIGVFSYEDDSMILDFSDEYYSAYYDEDLNAIGLEVKDDNVYYYKYFDLDSKSFKLNTKRLEKFENANIFYTSHQSRQSLYLTMLFNSKGESIKNLPFVVNQTIYEVSDRIITYADGYYKVYDLNGKFLYSSSFPRDKIVYYDKNVVIVEVDGKYGYENGYKSYIEICDSTETNSFSSVTINEEKEIVEVYIKDSSVTEEGMNGYKYTLSYDETTKNVISTPEVTYIK